MEDIPDCSFKTRIVEENYKFKWTMDNLSKLHFSVEMRSCVFCIDKHESSWYASFIYDSNSPAKLRLNRVPCAARIRIGCEVVIQDSNGKVYYEDKQRTMLFSKTDKVSAVIFSEIEPTVLDELKSAPNDTCDVIFMIKTYKFIKVDGNAVTQLMCEKKAKNSFCTKFWKRFLNKIGTDVTLLVQGEKIEVHKTVLSTQSPVFTKMFEVPMSESQNNTVVIDDISLGTMTELVHFMYSKAGFGYPFETALELYYAADKYEVSELREICGNILFSLITIDNAGTLLQLVEQHKDIRFKCKVVEFINSNVKFCLKKDWMLELIRKEHDIIKEVFSHIK